VYEANNILFLGFNTVYFWYRHKGIAYSNSCLKVSFFLFKSETSLTKTPGSFQNIFPLNFNFFPRTRMYIQIDTHTKAKWVGDQVISYLLLVLPTRPLFIFFLFYFHFPAYTVLLHFSLARNRKSFRPSICHGLVGPPHILPTIYSFCFRTSSLLYTLLLTSKQ